MHIKANDTVFNTDKFPIFFPEDQGISFLSLDTMKLHVRLNSPSEVGGLFSRILGAMSNGNCGLLDLDRDFEILDVFADHVSPMVNELAAA